MKHFLYLLLLPFILTACGNDEPKSNLFKYEVTKAPSNTETSFDGTDCGISTNGEEQTIIVTLLGDYDSFRVTSTIPDWIYTTSSDNKLKFKLSAYTGDESDMRSAAITFTVHKGNQSENGRIIIHQRALTYEDKLRVEQTAIKAYLDNFDVVKNIPHIAEIKVGNDAPYYKIEKDGNVYMQVVSKGNGPAATNGERIYFRFTRYDLLYYYKNGVLSNGWGNATDINVGTTSFNIGADNDATKQWGTGIQLPMSLGLPIDSEVNLIIASKEGFATEIANIIPFLYNVRYFKSQY